MNLVQSFQPQVFQRLRDGKRLGICGQFLDSLGNMASKVGKPFEITVDLEYRGHSPQVGCHRLVQGQNPHTLTFNLNFPAVHGRLLKLDLVREFDPTVTQGVNTLVQGIFNDRCKLEYLGP